MWKWLIVKHKAMTVKGWGRGGQASGGGGGKDDRGAGYRVQCAVQMEVGRLHSRLPACTVRSRLRITLTFGVFLVGSLQGALRFVQRAHQPLREPFDDHVTAV